LDILTVKGRSESVHIYELRAMLENGKTDPDQLFVACYEEGLRAYKERRWNDAQRKFREALTMNPNDHPTQLYMGRTDFFENHPPPADWDGRFTSPTS
jgi:adenylate cyclase